MDFIGKSLLPFPMSTNKSIKLNGIFALSHAFRFVGRPIKCCQSKLSFTIVQDLIKMKKPKIKQTLSYPSHEKILQTWWDAPHDKKYRDLLGEKTNGKLYLDAQTDRCWCCRALQDWWLDENGEIDQSRNTTIERCHIVPASLKGSFSPLNFVLLCSRCHRKSPDINSNTAIFKWMEAQADKRENYHKEWMEGCRAHFPELATTKGDYRKGLEKVTENILHFFDVAQSDEFNQWFLENTSYHFGESEKASTRILALREFIDKSHPFPNSPSPIVAGD